MFGCYTLRKSSNLICELCCVVLHRSELTLLSNTEYLDKTLVNYANVMGLQEDAGINGTQSQTATHIATGALS